MPYITADRRTKLDDAVETLAESLLSMDREQCEPIDGDVNYAVTTLLHAVYDRPLNYARINRAIGVLECIKLEFYRRLAAPYEDTKIVANGDV